MVNVGVEMGPSYQALNNMATTMRGNSCSLHDFSAPPELQVIEL